MNKVTITWWLVILSLSLHMSCQSEEEIECEKSIWYLDDDNDGLGTPNENVLACEQPDGYVANADDEIKVNNEITIPQTGFDAPDNYEGYSLTWSDEFNDNELDETYWNYQIGDGCPDLCGWGNSELQFYKEENLSFKDGNLVITAKTENQGIRDYTSTRINTEGKLAVKYGRVDIRAVMPRGKGIWPAVWMLGENIREVGWPKCGEIDILEMKGSNVNEIIGTVHWDNAGEPVNYGGTKEESSINLSSEFYVYSITWDEQFIRWYLNGEEYHVIDITPKELDEFQKEFHFLINLAVGGHFDGDPNASTQFPQNMIVDYIRVYQKDN